MANYKVVFEGKEHDEVFATYEEAEEHAQYLGSCYHTGGEILEMSNPGDYPYDPDDEPDNGSRQLLNLMRRPHPWILKQLCHI